MNQFVPFIFVLLAVIFLDPLMVLMPGPAMHVVTAAFFGLFAVYVLLVWNEKALDEREVAHRATSGRMSYLVSASIATVGILYQALVVHNVDTWLVLVLISMVVTKSITLRLLQEKH